jgi:hexosaminidase
MPAQFARYRSLGIHSADSAFAVKLTGTHRIELSNQADAGEIRYTLDGSDPTRTSKLYTTPVALSSPTTVKAATFMSGQRVSLPRTGTFDRASALRRSDDELRSCSKKLVLRLEDDAPREGQRAVFNVDILDPCWIWEQADLSRVTAIAATVGQVPFNFQVGDAVKAIQLALPQTPAGELEVRKDSCEGERIAVLPLAPAVTNHAVTSLPRVSLVRPAQGARAGTHDLCLRFTRRGIDPIWAIKSVQLFE